MTMTKTIESYFICT